MRREKDDWYWIMYWLLQSSGQRQTFPKEAFERLQHTFDRTPIIIIAVPCTVLLSWRVPLPIRCPRLNLSRVSESMGRKPYSVHTIRTSVVPKEAPGQDGKWPKRLLLRSTPHRVSSVYVCMYVCMYIHTMWSCCHHSKAQGTTVKWNHHYGVLDSVLRRNTQRNGRSGFRCTESKSSTPPSH